MNSQTAFTLAASGQPFTVLNHLAAATSITIAYVIAGAPTSLVITIEGIQNSTGDVQVLDSYSGVSNTTRTVNLSAVYDAFKITATFTGGQNVSIGAILTSTGAGPAWSASSLPAIQNRPF
jgi:hypothetical protein